MPKEATNLPRELNHPLPEALHLSLVLTYLPKVALLLRQTARPGRKGACPVK